MGIFDKFKKKVENNEIVLNIEKTNTIDGIAYDENDLKLVLLLADGMDWHDEKNHLLLLQEKINNYIAYIEEKQYLQKYSNVRPIIMLPLEEVSEENIGKCIKETLEVAKNARPVDSEKEELYEFWKDAGYKTFGRFSKEHICIELEEKDIAKSY